MLVDLAAFGGMVMESMTRTLAWRFLEIGRRLERALQIIALVRYSLVVTEPNETPILQAIVEVADSSMTYRARYLSSWQAGPVLDLLLTDETNPRSLAFQVAALSEHVDNLPREAAEALAGPERRTAMAMLNLIRLADIDGLRAVQDDGRRGELENLLASFWEQLPRLSDLISHKYLVHAGVPRLLGQT